MKKLMKKNKNKSKMEKTYIVQEGEFWTAYLIGQMGHCPIYRGKSKQFAIDAAKRRGNYEGTI